MRIKKLEIHGFKSFAERAVLNFGQGITGVVGPNGCGKSNIVDALRWCMGEMSAKHLRGRAMQDVIFSGSDSRGPMGLAEVTLTFDNDGNAPPQYAQFSEIAVTRRLHRDGTSEYLVNKVPARLRDITDLFLGTGVGTRAYSIIEQGRIGFIVSSKPEDRRSLIEEVAGITKFKARKKAAERRMESTAQNLQRVGDVVSELERQLQSLRRQAKRAEKYKELRGELRDLELHHASLETLRLMAMTKLAQSQNEAFEREAHDAQAGIAAHESSIEADRERLLEIERALQRDQAASAELDTKLAALERDLEHWRRQRDEAVARGHAARRDLEDAEQKLEAAKAEQEAHSVTLGHLTASVEVDRERLHGLDAAHGETQGQITSLDAQAEALRRSAVEHIHEGARQRTLIAAIAKRTNELRGRLEHSTAELEDVAYRRNVAETKARQLTEQRDALVSQMTDWRATLETNRAQLQHAVSAVGESDKLVRSLRDELSERRSRLESLQEIARHFEGYSDGVRSLMQPESGTTAVPGIRALITDVLDVPPELEVAVEAALGERLQYVVVDAQQVGVTAIAHLRSIAGGRSGFVPVEPRLDNATDARGDALSRVQARPGFEAVAEYLLRDVSIVPTLDDALLAWAQSTTPVRYVTQAGEVLDAFGTLIGGSEEGAGLLAKRREIRELEEMVAGLTERHEAGRLEHQRLEETRGTLAADIQRLERELHAADLERIEASKDLEAAQADMRRATDRAEVVEQERTHGRDELEQIAEEARNAEEAAQRAEAEQSEIDAQSTALTEQRAALAEELVSRAEELTRAKVESATRTEKLTGIRAALERLGNQTHELQQRIHRATNGISYSDNNARELADRIEKGSELAQETSSEALRLREALNVARARYDEDRAGVLAIEQQLREQRRGSESAQERLSSVRLELQRLELERKRISDHVFERHDVRIDDVLTDFHMRPAPGADAARKVSELDRSIKALGPINLTAIEECAEIETRYGFLVTQRDDLENALESLKRAIQRINRASRERFQEAFDAVNEMFMQVYPRLFRGGTAKLELVQSDDLLESGVEIIAQPPGKKLQNVSLMSGGEKALTATALVFAIFLIKPSPFCVLDEVDAPLDEANVGRFNEMLREISKISQFIVITHNKNTMTQADRLYGVTMQEPGMSTLVSVNLEDKREHQAA